MANVIGLLALALLACSAIAVAQAPPAVSTSCGPITGTWDSPGLAAFWGIPFAQPPVG